MSEPISLISLPEEVQKLVLEHLSVKCLLGAARVCSLWQKLCNLIAGQIFHRLPTSLQWDLRSELPQHSNYDADSEEYDYLLLLSSWNVSHQLVNAPVSRSRSVSLEAPRTIKTMLSLGTRLLLADSAGILWHIDFSGSIRESSSNTTLPQLQQCVSVRDSSLNRLWAIHRWRLLLAVGNHCHLFQQVVDSSEGSAGGFSLRRMLCSGADLLGSRSASVYDDRLALLRSEHEQRCLHVLRVASVDGMWVRMELLYEIWGSETCHTWLLASQGLYCRLGEDRLALWCFKRESWVIDDNAICSKPINLPKALCVRDMLVVPCIDTTQVFYDRKSYSVLRHDGCLLGKSPSAMDFVSCYNKEKPLCLAYTRGVLAVATESGKLLLFNCLEDQPHLLLFNRPSHVLEMGFNVIEDLAISFSGASLLVFVKYYKKCVDLVRIHIDDCSG